MVSNLYEYCILRSTISKTVQDKKHADNYAYRPLGVLSRIIQGPLEKIKVEKSNPQYIGHHCLAAETADAHAAILLVKALP